MSTTLLRPLGFSEILDGAFTLYRRHFVTFFATTLICFLPMPLLSLTAAQQASHPGPAVAGLLLLAPVTLVTMMAGWGALTWQAAQGINGQPVSIAAGFSRGFRSFLTLTGALILGYLLLVVVGILVIAVVGVLAGILVGLAGMAESEGGVMLLSVLVGLLFIVMLMAIFAVLFAVAPAVVVEHRGPWTALKRSWQLARGAWLRVAGVVTVSWLIVMLPTIGLYAVGAGTGLFSLSSPGAPSTTWIVIEASMSFLISSLTYPFLVAATTLLYFDRRVRAEAYDLEVAAEGLALSH